MDANSFLKRIILIGLFSALPTIALAAPGSSGHSSGGSTGGHSGGGHAVSASHGNASGRAYAWQRGNRNWHDPSGSRQWNHGDWHHGDWHHHRSFSFGFFPYWYPGYGYYDYGYPYYADYPDYYPDYPSDYGSGPVSVAVFVQDALARRGYYGGQVDGVIGSQTRGAIREFQHDNGLPVTGQINSSLLQNLRNARD